MKLVTFVFLLKCVPNWTSDVDEEYNLPLFPSPRQYDDDYVDERYLGRDKYSGCACRHSSKRWVVCFGAENCVRFPRNITIKEKSFKIRTSSIRKIQVGDMKSNTHLTYLEIEANYKLEELEPGCFKELVNLRNLSISYNTRLERLHERTFEGLVNLRELVLVKNGLNKIHTLAHALGPNFLPKLIRLKLNENQFFHVRKDDLLPLSGSLIEELGLVLCRIDYLHPESLLPLKKLSILRLGENTFNVTVITNLLKTMIDNKIPLTKLNLYGVGFRKNPPLELMKVIAKANITTLSLARNQFELITKESFPPMPNVKMLDLRETLTLDIYGDAFTGMPNLETLLLNKNKIPYIPDGVLLPQLTYLDLSSNSGNLLNPSYFSLGKNKFVNMTKLWGLNLSYNNIRVVLNSTFLGLNNLEILSLRNASLFQLKNGTFLPLKKLIFLDLENNPINANFTPLKKHIFLGLEKLQVLLLGGCAYQTFDPNDNPFEVLHSLRHLGLDRNNIITLSPQVLAPLKKLTVINLNQNYLASWQERIFANNTIEHLQISQNKLTSITKAMLKDFAHLHELDVSGNPFNCDCKLIYAISDHSYMKTNFSILELLGDDTPYCTAPSDYSNMSIAEYFDMVTNSTEMCDYVLTNPVIKISLVLIIIAISIFALSIIIYRYRWYIHYWMFLTKISIIRKGKILQNIRRNPEINYEFDAFVSYSNEDSAFVSTLVCMLENYEPYLKLCVYERDFQVGNIISDSVLENVARSRKTLLVVSNAYMKSQWCRWEAQVAENYRLFFQNENGDLVNDSIVVIKLGNLNKAQMTPMLKYLIKTRIYLQWESEKSKQKEFWATLRKTLAPPHVIRHARGEP